MIKLVECVPNISEGKDEKVYNAIAQVVETVEGVRLLDIDPGKATNRTVITFVGEPQAVVEAAFRLIQKASELIDMRKHKGEHPRFGATDVCPFIPIANISMEECAALADQLARRVGAELNISAYLYESAATKPIRRNLANVRSGEYEGLANKLADPEWKPDYGPAVLNERSGAIAIGARDFLVAYNINLNTTSTRRANSVAFDVREAGRVIRIGDPITGEIQLNEKGEPMREPGRLKSVKAIGWYIEEYGICQISMNLTNISVTPVHEAFDAVCEAAQARGLRVTGSELVGLAPKKVFIDAADFFLRKQERSLGISEAEKIKIAVKTLGLSELKPFDPQKSIIEYVLAQGEPQRPLVKMDLVRFADETASEAPAPGGGSISAYMGVLGSALGTMVANLSAHKRGWDDQWEYYSQWAEKGQYIKEKLLKLVDDDTAAFNGIIDAVRMPKSTPEEINLRTMAMEQATKHAIAIPALVMHTAFECFPLLDAMAQRGMVQSISDVGVGVLAVHSAIHGAWLNVQINCNGLKDQDYKETILTQGHNLIADADHYRINIINRVNEKIGTPG